MFDPVTAIVGMGALGIGSSLIGGSMQADAATDAANIQANSANQANQLQYQMFQEQQKLMQPWVQSGQGGLERLNYALYGQVPSSVGGNRGPMPQPPDIYAKPMPENAGHYEPVLAGEGQGGWTTQWVPDQLDPAVWGAENRKKYDDYNRAMAEWEAKVSGTPSSDAQMGGAPGRLSPDWRFSTQDWKDSPEYAVYSGARDAAVKRAQEALMAQGAASGMYGSGTMANALSQNMGELYAQYDPASLAAARQAAEAARTQEFNMLVGLSSPSGAQQVAQYAGQYGQQAGQNMIGVGNALAAGQMGAANAWGNAITSGTNQIANAYGQYQGRQNFNQWMNQPYVTTQYNSQGYASPQYQFPSSAYGQNQQWMQNSMSDFGS